MVHLICGGFCNVCVCVHVCVLEELKEQLEAAV